jgi:hypothetical protein
LKLPPAAFFSVARRFALEKTGSLQPGGSPAAEFVPEAGETGKCTDDLRYGTACLYSGRFAAGASAQFELKE